MNSKGNRVQDAIRSNLNPGDKLNTPTGRGQFEVRSFGHTGLKVDKLDQQVKWDVLDGVPAYMAGFDRGEIAIGARKGWADPGTLERFLQDGHCNNTMRASYVASILDASDICDKLPKEGKEKQRIRLRPEWWPSV